MKDRGALVFFITVPAPSPLLQTSLSLSISFGEVEEDEVRDRNGFIMKKS